MRPITVVLETGMQNPDEGPVLDPDCPSILRAEVRERLKLLSGLLLLPLRELSRLLQLPFWNGCEQEDACVADLVLHSHTDLLDAQ